MFARDWSLLRLGLSRFLRKAAGFGRSAKGRVHTVNDEHYHDDDDHHHHHHYNPVPNVMRGARMRVPATRKLDSDVQLPCLMRASHRAWSRTAVRVLLRLHRRVSFDQRHNHCHQHADDHNYGHDDPDHYDY